MACDFIILSRCLCFSISLMHGHSLGSSHMGGLGVVGSDSQALSVPVNILMSLENISTFVLLDCRSLSGRYK